MHELAGMPQERINFFVVVIGIVMEEHEFFHAGRESEGDRMIHATVAPAGAALEFGAVVLRIQNQHVGTTDEIKKSLVGDASARFGVGKKTDFAAGRGQPVAGTQAGMIGPQRADGRGAKNEIGTGNFRNFDLAREVRERDRKERFFHLAVEGGRDFRPRAGDAEDAQPAAGFKQRREKRQSLDVVPVRVGNQEVKVERFPGKFREERFAECPQASAGVEKDEVGAGTDFHAGGVAAVADRARSWHRNRAADAPKLDGGAVLNNHTLKQVGEKYKIENANDEDGHRGTVLRILWQLHWI